MTVKKTKKKVAKKKVTKKAPAKKKVTKKTATKKEEFDLTAIESEMASFGISVIDESEPEENVAENAVPFRNLALQKITGGVFQGKFMEMAADSQGGKSFHLYAIIGDAIEKMGGYAFLLDGEKALEYKYARLMGLNMKSKRFMLAERRTATMKKKGTRGEPLVDVEQFFKAAYNLVKLIRKHDKDMSKPIIIGVDSFVMFKTSDDLEQAEKGKDPKGYAAMQRAAKFNTMTTTYQPKFDQLGASLVVLNQLTKNYSVMFGDPWESNGEAKIKFNTTQRLKGRLVGKIVDKKTKRQIGVKVKWTTIKNRGVRPFQSVTINIYYNKGIDPMSGLEELLLTDGTMKESTENKEKGFRYIKEDTWHPTVEALVEAHPEALEPIWTGEEDDDIEELEVAVDTDANNSEGED